MLAEIDLAPGDVLYFPRGTVHQAMAQDASHSLHLTFSTYQRHTWRDLLEAAPLSPAGRRTLAGLAEGHGAWVHTDLPTALLDTHTVGRPDAAWQRWGGLLIQPRLPMSLTRELWRRNALGHALDSLAKAYLFDSLPPPDAPAPLRDVSQLLRGETRLRLRAARCARLVDENATGGRLEHWDAWEEEPAEGPGLVRAARGEGEEGGGEGEEGGGEGEGGGGEGEEGGGGSAEPQLVLYTNVANGRAFAAAASPAFEVLPFLARSVLQLLEAPADRGVRVGDLAAYSDARRRLDLVELLEPLVEHGVLVAEQDAPSRGREGGPGKRRRR